MPALDRSSLRTRTALLAVALVALAGLVAGCGGDDGSSDGGLADGPVGSSTIAPDDGGSGDADLPGGEVPDELADFPLPEGYEIPFPASDYGPDQDPRETLVLAATAPGAADEVAQQVLDALPGAGYTVDDSDITTSGESYIEWENPDGLPGLITFGTSSEGGVNININLFRAGIR